jgi:rhodanese-related sulfurtransferase
MIENDHRAFKDELFEQFARIPKALGSPKRLELIDLLAQGERTVEDLAHEAHLSVANTSQHLQTLKAAHLVAARREGLYAYYRLASSEVFTLWQAVRGVGKRQLAEIDQVVESYLGDRSALEAVSMRDLSTRLGRDEFLLLDVRPEAEYRAGHLPGARTIPVGELPARLKELPIDQEIVAYCRGPYCVFADEAIALLRDRGYQAARLAEGFPEWQAAGLPVSR